MKKEEWVEYLMNASARVDEIPTPPALGAAEIWEKVNNRQNVTRLVSFRQVRLTSIAAILLTIINVGSLFIASQKRSAEPQPAVLESFNLNLY